MMRKSKHASSIFIFNLFNKFRAFKVNIEGLKMTKSKTVGKVKFEEKCAYIS